jgi:hypothetical protein
MRHTRAALWLGKILSACFGWEKLLEFCPSHSLYELHASLFVFQLSVLRPPGKRAQKPLKSFVKSESETQLHAEFPRFTLFFPGKQGNPHARRVRISLHPPPPSPRNRDFPGLV